MILHNDDNLCVGGAVRWRRRITFFFSYDIFGSVWSAALQWLYISFVAPTQSMYHILQFGQMVGLLRSSYTFLQIIWMACVWIIRKERNNRIFHQRTVDTKTLSGKVKLLSFHWLRANMLTFVFSYHEWWRHPLFCMGVGL